MLTGPCGRGFGQSVAKGQDLSREMGEPPVRLIRAIKCSQSPDIVCAGDTGTQRGGHQCSLLQLLVRAHPECWQLARIPLPQKSRLFSEVAKPQSALAPGRTRFHGGEVAEVMGTPLGCSLLEDCMSPTQGYLHTSCSLLASAQTWSFLFLLSFL